MKVCLGNAPWIKKGYYGVRAGSRWPHFEEEDHRYMPFPFFLAYAAALLEKSRFEILLIDGAAERISERDFLERVKNFRPELIVLEVSTVSLEADLKMVKELRGEFGPAPKIALCGLHSGMYQRSFLKEHEDVDFVLKREYEYTLLELSACLRDGMSPDKVAGIIYRGPQGDPRETPDRPAVADLDAMPWPARHLLPKDAYEDLPEILPKPTAQMLASRGCPYKCLFCAWPQIMYGEHRYRARSPANVVDEMESLVREQGFKSIYFDDDTFGIGKERTLKLCREIKKRGLDVPWVVMGRADIFDEETLRAMADAGLRAVKYGIESGAQELVDNSGKGLDIRKAEETVRATKALGIGVHLTFMFGLPGETRETIRKTLDLALSLDPDMLQFSIATPFPGTIYFSMLEEEGRIINRDWQDYDGYSRSAIRTEELSGQDLEDALRDARRDWQRHLSARGRRAL